MGRYVRVIHQIIHTILRGIDIGAFMMASVLATRRNLDVRDIRIALGAGVAFLVPQSITGAYYCVILTRYTPYIANNISGPLLGGQPTLPFIYPIFYVAITLVVAPAIISTIALYQTIRDHVNKAAIISTGILSEAILVLMEFMNDGSRYPYLFLNGSSGTPINQLMNTLIPLPTMTIYTMVASTPAFTTIFTMALYYGIIRKYLGETEE